MYLKLFVLSLATGLVLGQDSSTKLDNPARIIGGYEVKPEFKYPWMVTIQAYGGHYCGGSLYNDDTVLTAAHCSLLNLEEYTVKVHRHNLTKSDKEEKGRTFKVKSILNHPNYVRGQQNDISIWKLDRPHQNKKFNFDLDTENLSAKTSTLTKVIGWGATSWGGSGPDVLMEVKVPIYSIAKCVADYKNYTRQIYPQNQFCAGYPEGNKDACNGDSGGPIFIEKYNRQILLGLVSWGYGCAFPKYPGVYSKVHTFINWIKQNIH